MLTGSVVLIGAEVTVKQLKEKIKELDERLESTAQVTSTGRLFP